jgi:REP element-mobilizing transposase RayT
MQCYIAAMAVRRMQQLELRMPTRGGRRNGAGRKRRRLRPTVAHARRPHFIAGHPVQVTLRMCAGVPSLREPEAWAVIVRVLRAMRAHAGFRIVHFSVMTNHIHAIVEGDARECFEAGMRALSTRLALRLNRVFGRRGRLIEHRYHARALSTPRAVRSSLQYVLCNLRKHGAQQGQRFERGWIDPRSSGLVFDGWDRGEVRHGCGDYGVSQARTWLLREGWRRWGLLAVDCVPGQPMFDSANVGLRPERPKGGPRSSSPRCGAQAADRHLASASIAAPTTPI